ncbi:TNFAIP3-interacting protein 1-like isoform X2 [Megalops cyprinoides]|uniref:TNFAIP3-interacting protein 1-like isoform X2 n=1 Tax=Megalops cyprinoides TaxID=118141 RepID=UPI001863FA11|nr:TNFAIP3-interacting protein 1-like isoform X2 [Megalops cyprinoides]
MSRESPNSTAEVVGSKPGLGITIPEDVQRRLGILETQKRELLEVNRKWDEQYRNMKKHYESKIMELRRKLAICDASAPEEEEPERKRTDLEERLLQAEQNTEAVLKRNSVVSADLLEAERQTRRLRLQNATLTRRGQHQESEIRRLNEVLREALLSTQDEARTRAEVLTHQLQIYEEDFLKERADRRRLRERNAELERRVAALRAELELARSQVTGTSPAAPKPWRPAPCSGCHGASRLSPAAGVNVCALSHQPVPPPPASCRNMCPPNVTPTTPAPPAQPPAKPSLSRPPFSRQPRRSLDSP